MVGVFGVGVGCFLGWGVLVDGASRMGFFPVPFWSGRVISRSAEVNLLQGGGRVTESQGEHCLIEDFVDAEAVGRIGVIAKGAAGRGGFGPFEGFGKALGNPTMEVESLGDLGSNSR